MRLIFQGLTTAQINKKIFEALQKQLFDLTVCLPTFKQFLSTKFHGLRKNQGKNFGCGHVQSLNAHILRVVCRPLNLLWGGLMFWLPYGALLIAVSKHWLTTLPHFMLQFHCMYFALYSLVNFSPYNQVQIPSLLFLTGLSLPNNLVFVSSIFLPNNHFPRLKESSQKL